MLLIWMSAGDEFKIMCMFYDIALYAFLSLSFLAFIITRCIQMVTQMNLHTLSVHLDWKIMN